MFLGVATIIIQQLVDTGRYHPTVAVESPIPGPPKALGDITFLRWKSKGHHTEGTETLEEARIEAKKIAKAMDIPELSCFLNEALLSSDPVFVVVTPNFFTEKHYSGPEPKNPFINVVGPDTSDPEIQNAIKAHGAHQAYEESVTHRPLDMN